MAHYFFDIILGGQLALDEHGTILPNMGAARREASRTAADLARDTIRSDPSAALTISVRTAYGPAFEVALQWSMTDAAGEL